MTFDEAQAIALGLHSLGYAPRINHTKKAKYSVGCALPMLQDPITAASIGAKIEEIAAGYVSVHSQLPRGYMRPDGTKVNATWLNVFSPMCKTEKETPKWICRN